MFNKAINIFRNLNNLSYQRSTLEAFGFYLAWLLLIMVASSALAYILALYFVENIGDEFKFGVRVGSILAVVVCTVLATLVAYKKKVGIFSTVLYALGTFILTALVGGLLGLIIPSFLTTRKVKKMGDDIEEVSVS